jgi:hypothetical protein
MAATASAFAGTGGAPRAPTRSAINAVLPANDVRPVAVLNIRNRASTAPSDARSPQVHRSCQKKL